MPKLLKTPLGIMLGLLVLIGFIALCGYKAGAFAADLGGNCCADLEERIAELEATTAKKGNRVVSLTIEGVISEAIVWYDIPNIGKTSIGSHTQVQSNSNRDATSYVRFKGEASVNPDVKVGFVLDVGVGGFTGGVATPWSGGLDTNALYTRQSFLYVKSNEFGRLSVGKQTLATYDIGTTVMPVSASWSLVHTPLSLAPFTGPTAGSALDVFDGGITESVKYVSPHFFAAKAPGPDQDGIWVEGDWASAVDANATGGLLSSANGNLWDVAVKGWKEVQQFRFAGQVGYRNGAVVDLSTLTFAPFTGFNLQDVKVWAGSGGILHVPTGVFVSGTYADLDYTTLTKCVGTCNDLKAWEVQAGVEERWVKLGKTSIFATYGKTDLSALGLGSANTSYGLGAVQNVDAAAFDFGVYWQRYSPDSTTKAATGLTGDVDVVMGTARIKF